MCFVWNIYSYPEVKMILNSLPLLNYPFKAWHTFHVWTLFKGEVRSWSNLISEERVKKFEQNSENLMKIGWKIRKLWHFEVSQIFTKHFLTSRYEYANEWVDDVIASQLAIYFVHKILKILIFCPSFWLYVPHIKIYWCQHYSASIQRVTKASLTFS